MKIYFEKEKSFTTSRSKILSCRANEKQAEKSKTEIQIYYWTKQKSVWWIKYKQKKTL